jgi:hypothetical protein
VIVASLTWTRCLVATVCGRCGHLIAVGDPFARLTIPGVKRFLSRCAACTDEPVPLYLRGPS